MTPKIFSSVVISVILLASVPFVTCQLRRQSQQPFRNNNNAFKSDLRLVQSLPPRPTPTFPNNNNPNPEPNKEDAFNPYLLPLCCSTINDGEIISYQCQNTLDVSSQEVNFKRTNWVAPRHLVSSKKPTKFKFVSTSLTCKDDMLTANLPLNGPINLKPSRTSYFSLDGYFKYRNEYYPPTEYCVSGLTENRIEVRICTTNCSSPANSCIQKCCGMNQIYSFGYGDNPRGCVDLDPNRPSWYPTLYNDLHSRLSPQELAILNPHIVHKFPTSFKFNCRFNKTTVFPHGKGISDFLSALTQKTFRNLEFRLRKDGWLLYPGDEGQGKVAKRIENYCVDGAQDYGESKGFSNLEEETVLFLCSGGVDEAFETPISPQSNVTSITPPIEIRSTPSTMTTPKPTPPRIAIADLQSTSPSTPPHQHLSNFKDQQIFKDRIELDLSSTGDTSSSSSSVEIEIEDGVVVPPVNQNSLEDADRRSDDDVNINTNSDSFIPAVLKVSVQVPPSPAGPDPTGSTGFNQQNNLKDVDPDGQRGDNAPPARIPTLSTCCNFDQNVNDGLTHHCRNKRLNDKPLFSGESIQNGSQSGWNLPEYFSTRGKSSQFLLRPNPLKCGSGKFQFQGFIHSFEQVRAKTSGDKRHGLLIDGHLKYDNEFYSPEQYCINGLSSRIIEILICKPDCSMWETPCIRRCCGMDEIYNLGLTSGHRGCQPLHPGETPFNPILYQSMSTPVEFEEMGRIQPHFVQKYPPTFQQSCFNKITLAFPYSQEVAEKLTPATSGERGSGTAFKHLQFRFRKDGKLMYSYPETDGTSFDAVFDRGEFCVDALRDGEKEYFRNNENQTILFICASEPHSAEK